MLQFFHKTSLLRFQDLLQLSVPAWVQHSFETDATGIDGAVADELTALQNEWSARQFADSFGIEQLWLRYHQRLPSIWRELEQFYVAFPKTWRAESGFSSMTRILTPQRSSLNLEGSGDIRLRLSTKRPNIDALARRRPADIYATDSFL